MAPQPKASGQSWNDDTVPIPRDADGNTPPLYTDGQARNFGTTDGDAHRRPTTLDAHGRVVSGDPQ